MDLFRSVVISARSEEGDVVVVLRSKWWYCYCRCRKWREKREEGGAVRCLLLPSLTVKRKERGGR
ncbi:hypothetical protein HAX54_040616, partial [Datura stramonium]|nr:hypothetical protein [Datura stramonium]